MEMETEVIEKFLGKEADGTQMKLLGRVEAILRFVFKYVILPLLLWELGFRWCYRFVSGIGRELFRVITFFFVTEKGGLFNGIEDGGYDKSSTEVSDTDSLFDELQREDENGHASIPRKESTTFLLRINSEYFSFMDNIENQQIWRTLSKNIEELFSILEKADYVFDRYIKHSPFCVLNKLNPKGKKSHYEYKGISLSKYEGFTTYLNYKRQISKSIKMAKQPKPPENIIIQRKSAVPESPAVKVLAQPISRLTQTEIVKLKNDKAMSVFSPPTFNFATNAFPHQFTHTNPKRLKLDKTRVQVSGISKPSQDKPRVPAVASKPRIINIEFPNKPKSGFKLLIRPKNEPSAKRQKQSIEVLSTSNTKRITNSISVDDIEYAEKVKHEIRKVLPKPGYDDGSLGPIILRLAWHCCATYNKFTGNGGSNGATMRFVPEITDDGNSGLDIARSALEPIKQKFPSISYSDLWTLAGKISIEEMGGPVILWKCGRVDCIDDKYVPPNGRLPFAYKKANHIRETFGRMGFNDRETVLLLGAHGLGRCHKRFSGWEGKWTENPISFTNDFYTVLLNEEWTLGSVPETGKDQYYNRDKSLIMLNTDIELIRDPQFLHFVKLYGQSQEIFFQDFADAFGKLLELGIERDSSGSVLPKKEFY